MAGGKVVQKVEALVTPIIESLGIELIETEYVKEGPNWYLRLYIDKKGGVSIDDCQAVNDAVTGIIDEADPIAGAYIFEVSSPGLDRPLKSEKDFIRYEGEFVEVKLYAQKAGCDSFEGNLIGKEDGIIRIKNGKGEIIEFTEKETACVKRAVRF